MGLRTLLGRNRKDAVDVPTEHIPTPPLESPEVHDPEDGVSEKREKYGLFSLYDGSSSGSCTADIVAVHGLTGDWEQTWTHDGKMWLRDFVPQQFPAARVWSFGYDPIVLGNSAREIESVATSLLDCLCKERTTVSADSKPIIFIAHSLGGIVVKQALIMADEHSDRWAGISDNTTGAVFFGVPHRGADETCWADLATRLAGISNLGFRGSRHYAKGLRHNSVEFSRISNDFMQPASKLKMIRTFYETNRMGKDVIVDRDSASLCIDNELPVPLQGTTHCEMCKFHSADSQKYRPVRNALEDIVRRGSDREADEIVSDEIVSDAVSASAPIPSLVNSKQKTEYGGFD